MLPPRVSAAHQVVLLSLVVCGTTTSSTTTSAGTGADAVAESAGAGHDTLIFTTSQERVASCLCCQYLFRILVSRNTLEEGYDFSWRVAWLRVTELPKWSRPLPHPAPLLRASIVVLACSAEHEVTYKWHLLLLLYSCEHS